MKRACFFARTQISEAVSFCEFIPLSQNSSLNQVARLPSSFWSCADKYAARTRFRSASKKGSVSGASLSRDSAGVVCRIELEKRDYEEVDFSLHCVVVARRLEWGRPYGETRDIAGDLDARDGGEREIIKMPPLKNSVAAKTTCAGSCRLAATERALFFFFFFESPGV